MEEDAFLQGLDANPNDDTRRLVFADWLEERGDLRAEFLRVAVALRSLPPTDEKFIALLDRLQSLRPAASAAWLSRAHRGLVEDDVREVVFRHLLGTDGAANGAYVQVEDGRDPSPFLMARLTETYPGLLAASAARKGSAGIFNRQTGEVGFLTSIDQLDWVAGNCCNVDGSFVVDGLAGQGHRYRVGIKNGDWTVLEAFRLWIS